MEEAPTESQTSQATGMVSVNDLLKSTKRISILHGVCRIETSNPKLAIDMRNSLYAMERTQQNYTIGYECDSNEIIITGNVRLAIHRLSQHNFIHPDTSQLITEHPRFQIALLSPIWIRKLFSAVKRSQIERLGRLLDEVPEMVAQSCFNKRGHTLLTYAADSYQGYFVLQYLLKRGFKVNQPNRQGEFPLEIAVTLRIMSNIQAILAVRPDISVLEESYKTHPLHEAVLRGSIRSVTNILNEHPEMIEAEDGRGISALDFAVLLDDEDMVELLLQRRANPNHEIKYKGFVPLHATPGNRTIKILRLLLNANACIDAVDEEEFNALHYAACVGNYEAAEYLIRKGINIHALTRHDSTALHLAAKYGHYDIVRLLLAEGLEDNKENMDDQTALGYAAKGGYLDIVNLLLGCDEGQQKALGNACESGHCHIILRLIEVNGSLKVYYVSQTALHNAVKEDQVDAVRLLISEKADVNYAIEQESCTTPLHVAAQHNSKDCVGLLLEAGANMNAEDKHGNTPLYDALISGSLEVFLILLEAGARVRLEDTYIFSAAQDCLKGVYAFQTACAILESENQDGFEKIDNFLTETLVLYPNVLVDFIHKICRQIISSHFVPSNLSLFFCFILNKSYVFPLLAEACFMIGEMLYGEEDEKAVIFLERAHELGVEDASKMLFFIYRKHLEEKDRVEVFGEGLENAKSKIAILKDRYPEKTQILEFENAIVAAVTILPGQTRLLYVANAFYNAALKEGKKSEFVYTEYLLGAKKILESGEKEYPAVILLWKIERALTHKKRALTLEDYECHMLRGNRHSIEESTTKIQKFQGPRFDS